MKNFVLKKEYNITLEYKDGNSREIFSTNLLYVDEDGCYLTTPMPLDFKKPEYKTPAKITVKTPQGVYSSKVFIFEANMSLSNMIFLTQTPSEWDITEYRRNARVNVEIPIILKFGDEFEIKETTYDIAMGGLSFSESNHIDEKYKNSIVNIILKLSSETEISIPAKFVRKTISNEYGKVDLLAYKYTRISAENEIILKHFMRETTLKLFDSGKQ